MILDFIGLFVTFLCLIIILMLIASFRFNRLFNLPFFIIILIVGLQRFQNFMANMNLIVFKSPFETSPFIALVFIPIFLFFFKNSLEERNTSYHDLIHLILPLLLLIIKQLQIIPDYFNRIIFLLFTTVYWILMLTLVLKNYKKIILKFSFNKIIFRWLILMFSNLTIITFFLNYNVLYWHTNPLDIVDNVKPHMVLTDFYRSSSIMWAICLSYVVLNPVIVFGKDYLLFQLNTRSKLYDPWKYKVLKKVENSDQLIYDKISKSVPDLIYSLKSFEQDFNYLNSSEINIKKLSKKLKIPNSHLKIIFKYYNYLTFHEYFNLLKIALSIKLIHQGFLHGHTIESLSKSSHFESRITFYNNFKKFTGKSPSEFIKT